MNLTEFNSQWETKTFKTFILNDEFLVFGQIKE